jgi:acetyltransferase-like isoleucine patch superfamily enzyme
MPGQPQPRESAARLRAKKALILLFRPAAAITERVGTPFVRSWRHARLASRLPKPLPVSCVLIGRLIVDRNMKLTVGERLLCYDGVVVQSDTGGHVEIGHDVILAGGVHIVAFERVVIGNGVMIGEHASIRDANHDTATPERLRDSGHVSTPVVIEDNVWIGRGVAVLPGVTIGRDSVIGANSVVTKDVPPGSTVVGVPAKPINR